MLELALRAIGYGHPTSFFLHRQINGQVALVENSWFGLRFFPPALARSPAPVVLRAEKPPGVFRIFLFGESAALGDPRPAYGVGRFLQTLLRERYPGLEFEVICVAMTAINSHAILPIARECTRYQGDLWIVYMGNNEMAGPFGANTVFGPQAPSAALVRPYLTLMQTRTAQWLTALAERILRSGARPTTWGGLKMFLENQLPPTDPRRERVHENFRRNLIDLVQTGQRQGVPIILSSIAENLKDCAPFASLHEPGWGETPSNPDSNAGNDFRARRSLAPPGERVHGLNADATRKAASHEEPLGPADLARWESLYQTMASAQKEGRWAEARTAGQDAAKLSPRFAELAFQLGRCSLELADFTEARRQFELARDWDALPFRADSRMQALIAEIAASHAAGRVSYLNAEAALTRSSPEPIPGNDFFFDHVHLNFDGNYRLAVAWAEQVAPYLPESVRAQSAPGWAEPAICAQRLALTDWNRAAVLEEVLRRLTEAPFTNQLNHTARFAQIADELRNTRRRLNPEAAAPARLIYEEAIRRQPGDHWLHHNYAEFLKAIGDLPQALAQMQAVRDLIPHHYVSHLQIGRLLARLQRAKEAEQSFGEALRLRPDLTEAHLELGQLFISQSRFEDALRHYEMARRYRPDDPGLFLRQAEALVGLKRPDEAVQRLRAALQVRPNFWEARYQLGVLLAAQNQSAAAQTEFEEAVRLRPDHALGHLNLGLVLAGQTKYDSALAHFQEVLRLDSQNEKARQSIEALQQLGFGRKASP